MTSDRRLHKKIKILSIGIAPHDGLISIGVIPHGLISIGLVPMGAISVGLVSMGLFSTGLITMGLVSFGRVNMSLIQLNSSQVQPQSGSQMTPHQHMSH